MIVRVRNILAVNRISNDDVPCVFLTLDADLRFAVKFLAS